MNIQKLGHSLAQASRWQSRYLIRHLAPFRLGPRTLPFYLAIGQQEGISQKTLMKKVLADKTQTTKALNLLVKEGYVKRVPKPIDNRIKTVFFTDEGRSLFPRVQKVLDDLDSLLSNELREKDIHQFIFMLDAFSSAVHQDMKDKI